MQPVLEKNQQLQTKMDITCPQNEQISSPTCYYEIPTNRKQEPTPTEETSGILH
jgi:hypothetical protein